MPCPWDRLQGGSGEAKERGTEAAHEMIGDGLGREKEQMSRKRDGLEKQFLKGALVVMLVEVAHRFKK